MKKQHKDDRFECSHFLFSFAIVTLQAIKQGEKSRFSFHLSSSIAKLQSRFLSLKMPSSTILQIQSSLESTSGTEAQDVRNSAMFGAARGQVDADLEAQQKALIIGALTPLTNNPAVIDWTPFKSSGAAILSPAFLAVTLDSAGNPHLRVLACPKPVSNYPESCISISGFSAFTRTSDPLPPEAFNSGDIEFSKLTFKSPITKLRSIRVQISTQKKQQPATYLGNSVYAAIKNIIPFCNDGSLPFNSPSSSRGSQRRSTNIALPICWPLPINHTITLADDLPLPSDETAMAAALASFHCLDSAWLTDNPYLSCWLAAVHSDPALFASNSESFFSLNEADTLNDYQASVSISRSVIADHLLARNIPELSTAILADPSLLSSDTFPPSTMDPAQICSVSLVPSIPWIPSFSFQTTSTPALPPQPAIPKTLTTTNTSVASTVSTSSLTTSSSARKVVRVSSSLDSQSCCRLQ